MEAAAAVNPDDSLSKMEKGASHGRRKVLEDADGAPLGEGTDVSWVYLTFDTPLPQPPSSPSPLPKAPDLRAYTNPQTWSVALKSVLLALSCIATFLTAYSAGSYSPPAPLLAADLDSTRTVVLIGITTFCMGFALAPMVLAPVSEIWGRYPIFAVAGLIWVVCEVACALVGNLAGLLVARFFVGAGASVFSSVVGGVLADLWVREERNTPMALFSGGVLAGTGAGPLVAAGIVYRIADGTTAWRWTFWHQAISDGILLLAILVFFRETRANVLLSRKAAKLNKWYEQLEQSGVYGVWVSLPPPTPVSLSASDTSGAVTASEGDGEPDADTPTVALRRIRWKVQADEERASLAIMMTTSFIRPFHLLVTEPIVFFFSLWAAFAWSVLYLAFAVVPYLYGDDFSASSRTYVAMMVGSAVATVISIWQESLLHHREWRVETATSDAAFWRWLRRRFPAESPESRLYFTAVFALLLPAGLFGAFLPSGVATDGGTSVAIGLGFATVGIYAIYLATFNYLADSYQIYASSALAANSFCRNVLGGAFPVATAAMFDAMGLKGAGGMLGGVATVLSVTPWVLIFWGEKIRARSRMAIVSILDLWFEGLSTDFCSCCGSEDKSTEIGMGGVIYTETDVRIRVRLMLHNLGHAARETL